MQGQEAAVTDGRTDGRVQHVMRPPGKSA